MIVARQRVLVGYTFDQPDNALGRKSGQSSTTVLVDPTTTDDSVRLAVGTYFASKLQNFQIVELYRSDDINFIEVQ